MPSRPTRRQGVIYGPPRPADGGRDGGAILGRLLGLAMIVLAVGVLGAGAVALLNGPTASHATPTPSANPSTNPSTTPTGGSPTPTLPSTSPSPAPSASPTTSPSPSPFVPTVNVGPGFVTFGTRSDRDLRIVDPSSTFRLGQSIVWSAYLSEAANSVDLRVRVFKLDAAAENGERLVSEPRVQPRVQGAQRFFHRVSPAHEVDGVGVYVVRYLRGETLLSEGYFLIEG